MPTAQPQPSPGRAANAEPADPGGQRLRWLFAVAGVVLLVVSVVMMAVGAQPSRAQTVHPALAPGQLARLRLPAPTGRYQVGTVSLHLVDRSRPNPWVASEVEFPSGRLADSVLLQRLATARRDHTVPRLLAKVVAVRVADTRYVLGELPSLDAGRDPGAGSPPLPRGLAGSLDLNEIGMFGVSGGGFTAAQTMYEDARIKAGIDIDGTLEYTQNATGKHLSTVARRGLNRPFMLMGSPRINRNQEPSWKSFWSHSHGWHLDLTLNGSDENSYKDAVALIPQIAADLGLPHSFVTKEIGTVNPPLAMAAEDAYITAFFDRFLKHGHGHLLDAPSPRYPNITFVK